MLILACHANRQDPRVTQCSCTQPHNPQTGAKTITGTHPTVKACVASTCWQLLEHMFQVRLRVSRSQAGLLAACFCLGNHTGSTQRPPQRTFRSMMPPQGAAPTSCLTGVLILNGNSLAHTGISCTALREVHTQATGQNAIYQPQIYLPR
jgi:hypothetical protein